MEWWQTLLLSLGGGTIPVVLLWVLQRNGANKRLEIEEGGLEVTQFDVLSKAYQDQLDRAQATTEAALKELAGYKEERQGLIKTVTEQGEQLEATNTKLDQVRKLFQKYIDRVGIPLTTEELKIFEDTIPTFKLRSKRA